MEVSAHDAGNQRCEEKLRRTIARLFGLFGQSLHVFRDMPRKAEQRRSENAVTYIAKKLFFSAERISSGRVFAHRPNPFKVSPFKVS